MDTYFKYINVYLHCFIQVEVNSRESGERLMNNRKFMAFIYFPKNYTSDLAKYIDDRKRFDMNFRAYVHLTKESEFAPINM